MDEETVDYLPLILDELERIAGYQSDTHQILLCICCFIGVCAGLLLIRILMDKL